MSRKSLRSKAARFFQYAHRGVLVSQSPHVLDLVVLVNLAVPYDEDEGVVGRSRALIWKGKDDQLEP
jgi:hypothetical protein